MRTVFAYSLVVVGLALVLIAMEHMWAQLADMIRLNRQPTFKQRLFVLGFMIAGGVALWGSIALVA